MGRLLVDFWPTFGWLGQLLVDFGLNLGRLLADVGMIEVRVLANRSEGLANRALSIKVRGWGAGPVNKSERLRARPVRAGRAPNIVSLPGGSPRF